LIPPVTILAREFTPLRSADGRGKKRITLQKAPLKTKYLLYISTLVTIRPGLTAAEFGAEKTRSAADWQGNFGTLEYCMRKGAQHH
jgi:hypothetical protein